MPYKCRIYTPEFKAKLDQAIEEEVQRIVESKSISLDRVSIAKSFARADVRSKYNHMYNKPEMFNEYPDVIEYYKSIGLYPAEYTEIVLEKADHGYQSRPRVEWQGKIEKIDEIDEIFSYITV